MIYNRVPKTASTSFVGLVYDLCKQNKYHVLHINVTNNMHTLTFANQVHYTLRKIYALLGYSLSFFELESHLKSIIIFQNIFSLILVHLVSQMLSRNAFRSVQLTNQNKELY